MDRFFGLPSRLGQYNTSTLSLLRGKLPNKCHGYDSRKSYE